MTELKYPIILLHGLFFRDRRRHRYWGRIPKYLESLGCKVYFGQTDGSVSVERNGELLKKRILEVLEETGAEKVNVIAHCKGGLDARDAITRCGMGQYVASLTTVCSPHHGSKPLEKGMNAAPRWFLSALVHTLDFFFRLGGDPAPDTLAGARSCTRSYAEEFNARTPDDPRVYYQSYGSVCPSPIIRPILFPFHVIVRIAEGENDGLLSPESVVWTNFKGILRSNSRFGISHCDVIDWRRRRFTKKAGPGVSDILDFYGEIVRDLASRGF